MHWLIIGAIVLFGSGMLVRKYEKHVFVKQYSWYVLYYLYRSEGCYSVRQLLNDLDINLEKCTLLAKSLVKRDLIKIEFGSGIFSSLSKLELTPKGREYFAEYIPRLKEAGWTEQLAEY